jgi:hypothetical protein
VQCPLHKVDGLPPNFCACYLLEIATKIGVYVRQHVELERNEEKTVEVVQKLV